MCIAKTQASLSDDPALLGAPAGFTVTVRSVTVSAGAGFLVALTGDVLTMPGLPKVPAAENIDVDDDGRITRPVLSVCARTPFRVRAFFLRMGKSYVNQSAHTAHPLLIG